MRYSRMQSSPRKRRPEKPAAFLALIVICGTIVYFVGIGKVGSFISDKIVTPVMAFISGSTAPDPVESANTATESISINGITLYAIQAGVFTADNNAQVLAESVRSQGGAGYIFNDNGYRVLLSAYTSNDDAKTIKSRLKEQNNMDTTIYTISCENAEFSVTAGETTLKVIKDSAAYLSECMAKIQEIGSSLDKGTIKSADVAEQLAPVRTAAANLRDSLDSIRDDAASEFVDAMYAFYVTVVECADSMSKESDNSTVLSAELKYSYIALVKCYCDIAA